MKVATVVASLLQPSLAVKVIAMCLLLPQSLTQLVVPLLSLQVTPLPQASLATAPPRVLSQVAKAAVLPLPSHSTVAPLAGVVIEGAIVSLIVKVATVVASLLQPSLAVKVIAMCLLLPQSLTQLVVPLLSLQVTPLPQASLATAPPRVLSQVAKAAVLPLPSHSTVAPLAGVVIEGPVVSLTVMIC